MAENTEDLGSALEAALREVIDDNTFKKVRRISYAHQENDDVSCR